MATNSRRTHGTEHRSNLNNIIKADHGALKRVIKPTRGFQTMRTATATIKGFEIMRMIRRRSLSHMQARFAERDPLCERLFQVAA